MTLCMFDISKKIVIIFPCNRSALCTDIFGIYRVVFVNIHLYLQVCDFGNSRLVVPRRITGDKPPVNSPRSATVTNISTPLLETKPTPVFTSPTSSSPPNALLRLQGLFSPKTSRRSSSNEAKTPSPKKNIEHSDQYEIVLTNSIGTVHVLVFIICSFIRIAS